MVEHGRIAAIEIDQQCSDFVRFGFNDARTDGPRFIACRSNSGGGCRGFLLFRVVERQQVRDVSVRCAPRQLLQDVKQVGVRLDVARTTREHQAERHRARLCPSTVSLNIHDFLEVQNGLMSRSVALLSTATRQSVT